MFGIADLRYSIPESSIVKSDRTQFFCSVISHNNNYNNNKNNTVLSCLIL